LSYWKSLGVDQIAVLHLQNDYGVNYVQDLQHVAKEFQMEVRALAYSSSLEDLPKAMDRLRKLQTNTNYCFGIFGTEWREVSVELYRNKLMGQRGTSWMIAEVSAELIGMQWELEDDASNDDLSEFNLDLARAVNGSGCLLLRPPDTALERMNDAWENLKKNELEWEDYLSKHMPKMPAEDEEEEVGHPHHSGGASTYSLLAYDAVMALGLASCQAYKDEGEYPTGPKLINALKWVEFVGASGAVAFDNMTLTRKPDGIKYEIRNLLAEHQTHHGKKLIVMDNGSASIIIEQENIREVYPFKYPSWTEIPPDPMAVTVERNLIGTGHLSVCYSLCGVSMALTIVVGLWTYVNRNKPCVRESQPYFLGLLCLGAFLMATAMIPLGFQEDMEQGTLDAGCMAVPWLLASGFTLAYSALFSKVYRINQVFKSAKAFQRVKVRPVDVLRPLIILMVLNFSVLTVWTIVSPLRWVRTVTLYDQFGRPLESFGSCLPESDATWGLLLLVIIINGAAIIIANYQSYLARNLPSRWNESFYIGLTNFIILETAVVSVPAFVLEVRESFLVVSCLAIFVLVMAVMLPAFLPKILMDNTIQRPKILRLNKAVSAYPSRVNPLGLFSGLSFRGLVPVNNRHHHHDTTNAATNDPTSNEMARDDDENHKKEVGCIEPPHLPRVSFSRPQSQGTQETSRSTVINDSSRELVLPASPTPNRSQLQIEIMADSEDDSCGELASAPPL
jgi:hypothetical protein